MGVARDLAGFTRLRMCALTAFLGPVGMLLSGSAGPGVAYVYLASLLLCMGVYSHNDMTDLEEDRINKRRANRLRGTRAGAVVSALLYASGLSVSVISADVSLAPAALFMAMGLAYNVLGIKRLTIVKNVYTSFGISLIFMAGIPAFTLTALQYQSIVFVAFLVGSIISDLRDLEGDSHAGIRTLPVAMGEAKTRKLLFAMMAALLVMIVLSPRFLALLPFELAVLALMAWRRAGSAHAAGGISMPFLALSLAFI